MAKLEGLVFALALECLCTDKLLGEARGGMCLLDLDRSIRLLTTDRHMSKSWIVHPDEFLSPRANPKKQGLPLDKEAVDLMTFRTVMCPF